MTVHLSGLSMQSHSKGGLVRETKDEGNPYVKTVLFSFCKPMVEQMSKFKSCII